MRRSTSRLKAMAAERAKTMHSTIPTSSCQRNGTPSRAFCRQAKHAARSANGSAKSVWLNRIISRMCRSRVSIDRLLLLGNAQLVELLGDIFAMRFRRASLVDLLHDPLLVDVERPALRDFSSFVDDSVQFRGRLFGVAEDRVIQLQRLGEFGVR